MVTGSLSEVLRRPAMASTDETGCRVNVMTLLPYDNFGPESSPLSALPSGPTPPLAFHRLPGQISGVDAPADRGPEPPAGRGKSCTGPYPEDDALVPQSQRRRSSSLCCVSECCRPVVPGEVPTDSFMAAPSAACRCGADAVFPHPLPPSSPLRFAPRTSGSPLRYPLHSAFPFTSLRGPSAGTFGEDLRPGVRVFPHVRDKTGEGWIFEGGGG